MPPYIKLLRPKDWAKNLFLFLPLFFGGKLFEIPRLELLFAAFFAFCFVASTVYIINDYRDIEDDKKHPKKRLRPLASGAVNPTAALVIAAFLLIIGFTLAYFADTSFRFISILGFYFLLNMGYSFGLKNIPILDILIVAIGFSLRVKSGGYVTDIDVSPWLNLMVLLLALFMAIAKRRDDIILKMETGMDMRKAIKGYNVDFLNTMLAMFSAIIIMTYIMYCVSPITTARTGTYHLYYTAIFVIAGLMRYLQITLVQNKAGSPTEILYKDRFIQITLLFWVAGFAALLYWKDNSIFS
ncbi:MAG TPA: decaprenyl-phosphate phosphoribosyltransferase [Chitinophagaceae bacterium]|nr:decaprenyl-phosphate phosphoribosyltransferase [Chitinophagaceae bacterium]